MNKHKAVIKIKKIIKYKEFQQKNLMTNDKKGKDNNESK